MYSQASSYVSQTSTLQIDKWTIVYQKISYETEVNYSLTSTVGIVMVVLLAATRGKLLVSTVPLAQDLGKTLIAAPLSIKYLHLFCLSATYNSLEGDDARVATSRWLIIS